MSVYIHFHTTVSIMTKFGMILEDLLGEISGTAFPSKFWESPKNSSLPAAQKPPVSVLRNFAPEFYN
jgi:hypothetical protein